MHACIELCLALGINVGHLWIEETLVLQMCPLSSSDLWLDRPPVHFCKLTLCQIALDLPPPLSPLPPSSACVSGQLLLWLHPTNH